MSNGQEVRQEDDVQAVRPTIDYAGRENAPGNPRIEAAYRLAQQKAEAFGPQSVGDRCICCGTRSAVRPVEVIWLRRIGSFTKSAVSVLSLFAPVHYIWRAPTVAYATYHAFCDPCRRSVRRNAVLGQIATALGVLAATIGVVGVLACLGGFLLDGWRDRHFWESVSFLALLGVLGGGLVKLGRRLEAPQALQEAKAEWFGLRKMRVVADDVRSTATTLEAEQEQFRRQVEGAIAAGNLYQLGRVVGSLAEAVRVYGEYCEAKYDVTRIEESCCRCGAGTDLMDVVAEWQAPVDGNRTTSSVVSIKTHHRMCQRCWGTRFRLFLASCGLATVEVLLALPGGLAAIGGVIGLFMPSGVGDRVIAGLICAAGTAACVATWRLEGRRQRLRVPSRIAGIALKPYLFAGVKRVGAVGE